MTRITVQVAPALARRRRERPSPASAATAALLRRAARAALDAAPAEVSITLLDDDGIAALNRQWLHHEGPTDVISFPLYEADEPVVGDIYIGFDQVVRQARDNDVPVREELARVAIHGVLHVLGFDHPDGGARLRSAMWRRQERILAGVVA